MAIELVVLDMAGTTVSDDGTVERAFGRVAERQNIGATAEEREAAARVRARHDGAVQDRGVPRDHRR